MSPDPTVLWMQHNHRLRLKDALRDCQALLQEGDTIRPPKWCGEEWLTWAQHGRKAVRLWHRRVRPCRSTVAARHAAPQRGEAMKLLCWLYGTHAMLWSDNAARWGRCLRCRAFIHG